MGKFIPIFVFIASFVVKISYGQSPPEFSFLELNQVSDTLVFLHKIEELDILLYREKMDISHKQVDQIIKKADQLNSTHGLGYAYAFKALVYEREGEVRKMLKYHQRSLAYFLKVKDTMNIMFTYEQMFIIEKDRGNYEKSIEYATAQNDYLILSDSNDLSMRYYYLGIIYDKLNNTALAEKEYLKALSLMNQNDDFYISEILFYLSKVYLKNGDLDKVLNTSEKALFHAKKRKNRLVVIGSYIIKARAYTRQQDYQKAKIYLDSTFSIAKTRKLVPQIQEANLFLSRIELELGNYKDAKKLLDMVTNYYESEGAKPYLIECYETHLKLDSIQGNLKGALNWSKKITKTAQDIREGSSFKDLESTEEEFQTELDNLKFIKLQEAQTQQAEQKIFWFRTFAFVGVTLFISSLFVLGSITQSQRVRKKIIQDLEESNQIKNQLFAIISHDLKNEIYGLETSLNLMRDEEISVDDFKEILPVMTEGTNQTSTLLTNLLHWSKSQMNELVAKPVQFDIQDLITKKFNAFATRAKEKNVELKHKIEQTIVYADKDMIDIVFQNLLENAIELCTSSDIISLSCSDKGGFYELKFSDTSTKISTDAISDLFAEETFSTNGTQNESGTGLGLRICKELVELNNGTIRVESTLGQGTTFIIQLPKS